MDLCLKRLRQELLSMKEAGDGLHAQMNSMMGALQELKLLQIQMALEQLEISGQNNSVTPPSSSKPINCQFEHQDQLSETSGHEDRVQFRPLLHGSVGTSPSISSLESESMPLPKKISGYTAPQVEYCGPKMSQIPVDQTLHQNPSRLTPVDLSGILTSLSREGPSLDSDYIEDSLDDSSDWTSSLMSRSRNRQPLVLGDNVLADLVGNWLDLPEVDKDCLEEAKGINRPDSPAHPLYLSRSQELCKRFSLTSNIFKRFLRSVRPDRDKLLKEKPGWMPPGHESQAEIFKRPKKTTKAKGRFYLPFWTGDGQQEKGKLCPQPTEESSQFLGVYLERRSRDSVEKVQPLLDYNTAVWV